MTSSIRVKTEPVAAWESFDTVCRLCMSEESLGDVFREEGLVQWIWDYLAILVSREDRLSRVVCTICRIQLTEFHRFRIRCQDVQGTLLFTIRQEDKRSMYLGSDPGNLDSRHRACRLCMSEESLGSVFKQEGLHELMLDYLSIVLYCEDRLSHNICAICRWQLTEFHQFRIRCQEVQSVLQSRMLAGNSGVQQVEPLRNSTIKSEATSWLEPVEAGNASGSTRVETYVETSSRDFSKQEIEDGSVNVYDQQKPSDLDTNNQIVNETINVKTEPFDEVNICIEENKAAEMQPAMVYIPSDIVTKQETTSPAENHLDSETEPPNDTEDSIVVEEVKIEPRPKKPPYRPKELISPCYLCERVCKTKDKLKRHIKIVHGPRLHECQICNFKASLNRDLRKHLQTKLHFKKLHESLGDEAFAVPVQSKKVSDSEQSANEPEVQVKEEISEVQVKEEIPEVQIKQEIEQSNDNEDEETLIEEMKSDSMGGSDGNEPSNQTESEGQQLQCDVCHKMFPMDREKLLNHKWYAHGFNKFECPICGRPFLLQFRMQLHMRTHEGPKSRGKQKDQEDPTIAKPFKCEVCQEEFRLKKTYNYHRRQKHGLTDYVCSICEKPFAYPYQLKEHMEQNDHSRIVKRGPNKMRVQIKGDGSGKSYTCGICHKIFNALASLYTHQKMTHAEKTHKCSICDKAFAFRSMLKVHVEKRHENPKPRKPRKTKTPATKIPAAGDGPLTRAKNSETKPPRAIPNYCEDSDD
ncbi:zinc finger protein 134-like [Aedes albopictus]|uniref:C2h2-type zn-finger protein n=1 Tax=Aedes albopictus TaxID=7160 RepID=A0ABM1YRN8_AEDAL|nr:zinc finger protein 134-like [Aedes albopictus]